MNKMIIFLPLIVFFLFSCKSIDNTLDSDYRNCIIEKTKKDLWEGYGEKKDLFTILREAENVLLKDQTLYGIDKESYLKLTSVFSHDINKTVEIRNRIKTVINPSFFSYLWTNTFILYSSCPEVIYNQTKDEKVKQRLKYRFVTYAKLMNEGYQNEVLLIDLINQTNEFSDAETQRLIILSLLFMSSINK